MGGPIQKNGKDQSQDRMIAAVEAHVNRLEEKNSGEHEQIRGMVTQGRTEFTAAIHKIENQMIADREIFKGELKGDRRAVLVGWAITGVMVTIIGSLLVMGLNSHTEALRKANNIATDALTRIEAWIPEATRWGNNLDRGIEAAEKHSQERHETQQMQLDKIDRRLSDIERRQRRQGE